MNINTRGTKSRNLIPVGETIMEALNTVSTAWPMFVGFIGLVIVLARMHTDIEVLKDKIKTLFELFNDKK
jgi:hypothetical protein